MQKLAELAVWRKIYQDNETEQDPIVEDLVVAHNWKLGSKHFWKGGP